MAGPYSEDLRLRAVAAVEGGLSRHKAAERFSVGVSSVIRWCKRKAETGGGRASRSTAAAGGQSYPTHP